MVKRAVLILAVAVLLVAGLAPVAAMFVRSLDVDGQFSLANYESLLVSGRQWTLLANSLALASLTTILALAIGVPLGVLLGRTDLPLRRALAVLFTVPLLVPPYIIAVSWFDVLGPQGFLSQISAVAAEHAAAWLFGLWGNVLVLTSVFTPVVMLLTMVYLKTVNPRLEEAGKLAAGWCRVLWGITLPLVWPGILLAAVLVFLLAFGELGVPMFLRFSVFPVESFTQFTAFYNFGAATAAAAPMAGVTLLVFALERALVHQGTVHIRFAPQGDAASVIRLGRYRRPLGLAAIALCFLMVAAPLVALVARSMSVGAYAEAFAKAGDSLVRSIEYAALGASLLAILGFLLGYMIQDRALKGWPTVDWLTIFLFALPGSVIGIGLISLWNRPATNFVYGSFLIILLGYVAQYAGVTSRITAAILGEIPPSMEEAAQLAGARWPRRVLLITAPIARRGLVGAWLVGYIFCLRDVGISIMVYPPGQDTLPVRILTRMANGTPELIAALCVVMVLCALVPLAVLGLLLKWRGTAR